MLIHLINLDRSANRLQEFRMLNGHLSKVLRFSAIDGRRIDVSQLVRSGLAKRDILTSYTLGAVGAAMSHIALWERAIATGKPVTVCEDDAIFNFSFGAQADTLLDRLPANWDFILWGWNFDASLCFDLLPGVSSSLVRFEQDRLRENIHEFQRLSLSTSAYRLKSFFGLTCYSVSPKGGAALKAACLPLKRHVPCHSVFDAEPPSSKFSESIGIDTAVNSAVSQLHSYVCFPPLVVTKNEFEYSTIQRDA
ncbi:hypothetical protein B5K03_09540 [Rhizobium phaseoli]|uniref:glycosyltransferase family 25 protein n=1 Tax=Rhizobium phaseoli TaxID=396 RepID=UPI000D677CF5|nr:glycosyltransferase family 25 protein [Rhizobium phaseoli]PWI54418.1 hypothetical protein B5K03_09540 [Rhizobium phaseoli]